MPSLNFQNIQVCETSEEDRQSVCENLNTNLSQLDKDVQVLKDWVKNQPHIPQISSDTMLKTFLLACKNKMEKAKTKLENYYIARAEMPEIFNERDSTTKKITEDAELIHLYTLPKRTPDGCGVTMAAFRSAEAKKFDTAAFSKRALMTEDIKINVDPFVNGYYFVLDGRYVSMGHILKLTPRVVRNLVHCAQNVLPIIIKGIIFINSPSYMEIVVGLMKPFMKSKMYQRIHVHTGGPEVLEKYFPKALLPVDYGGEEDCSEKLSESWLECVRENRDWFLNEGQQKVDKFDVNKNKASEKNGEFQELQGSFKSLCID